MASLTLFIQRICRVRLLKACAQMKEIKKYFIEKQKTICNRLWCKKPRDTKYNFMKYVSNEINFF